MGRILQLLLLIISIVVGTSLKFQPSHLRIYQKGGLKARAIVVSCMDFRLINKVNEMMLKRGYSDNYDFFVLAGASLGYVQQILPYWRNSLHDHLHYAIALHHIREIIFVDHMDCGLYKQFFGPLKYQEQLRKHIRVLHKAKILMKKHYPSLKFYGTVMDLHGKEVYTIQ